MSVQGIPPGVSQAFIQKQVEIQRKLESDVTEIKKIEAGKHSHIYITITVNLTRHNLKNRVHQGVRC